MRRSRFGLSLVVAVGLAVGLILLPVEAKAEMRPGYGMGPGTWGEEGYEEWNFCPYCGRPLWGPPGMMGLGYGRGPGMGGRGYRRMHRGWERGPQYGPPYAPRYQEPRKPLNESDAKEVVKNYLRATRNPNLKVGKVTDKDTYFEVEILTKGDSLADKLVVDKKTGWMRSIY